MADPKRVDELMGLLVEGKLDAAGQEELSKLLGGDEQACKDALAMWQLEARLRHLHSTPPVGAADQVCDDIKQRAPAPGRMTERVLAGVRARRGSNERKRVVAFAAAAAALLLLALLYFLARPAPRPRNLVKQTPPTNQEAEAPISVPPAPEPEKAPEPMPVPPRKAPAPVQAPEPEDTPEPPPPAEEKIPESPPDEKRPVTVEKPHPVVAREVKGGEIRAGDRVEGKKLIESGGVRIALKTGAACTIPAEGVVRIETGEMAFSVPGRSFQVRTPQGTVSVKGTVFLVSVKRSRTEVSVAEGSVELSNETHRMLLRRESFASFKASGSPVGPRRIDVGRKLAWAKELGIGFPRTLWLEAAGGRFERPMKTDKRFARGSLSGKPVCADLDLRTFPRDALYGTWALLPDSDVGGWVTMDVNLPEEAEWFLWGRFYYPGRGVIRQADGTPNDPNSFYVRVDDKPELWFGNLKTHLGRWHWDGDGKIEEGEPAPLRLGRLSRGPHVIRIRTREAIETREQALSPRLDLICLTTDPRYVPEDADYLK